MCDCGDNGVRRESSYDMMNVDEAIELVLQHSEPLDVERIEASEALGVVLAEAVISPEPLPPFRASIMDGYAVIAADGVGNFPVVESITAGQTPMQSLQPGQVSYITTGSPVPDGADAVVKIEDTDSVDNKNDTIVHIRQAVKEGQNIRAIGSDIAVGQVLIPAHSVVSAADIGLLATVGIRHVAAYRRPLVGVLSTGNELLDAFQDDRKDGPHIRDANRPLLLALLRQWDVETLDFGICRDDNESVKKTLLLALETVDVLITSGGVSMGSMDHVKPVLETVGRVHFGRLGMKPGKPTTFATVEMNGTTKRVFALPGNPVSAFTTCHLLVRPALERLRGRPLVECHYVQVDAVLSDTLTLDRERPEFHRARVVYDVTERHFLATSTGRQASSRLLSCHNANALVCLPRGTEMRAGQVVKALLLDQRVETATNKKNNNKNNKKKTNLFLASTSETSPRGFRAGLLTISDRVFAGEAVDTSGPTMAALVAQVEGMQLHVVAEKVVPDDVAAIQRVVKDWADFHVVDLILTSGGTGFSPRDVTPEAIKPLLDKDIPGFPLAMLVQSLQITPKAILSRPVAGIRNQTVIVTLPGKPTAVKENFAAIAKVLPHALHLVRDVPHEHHRQHVVSS